MNPVKNHKNKDSQKNKIMKISNGANKGLKIFFAGLFLSLPFWWGMNVFQQNLEEFFYAQISQPFQEISFVKIPPRPEKPEIEAKSALLVKINKLDRQKILFRKNTDLPLPIASISKLMTAVILLEDQNYDLKNSWITVSEKAASQEDVPNYGNLKAGEGFPTRTLFELMLIYSSNDAAWTLAEVIDPGTENFVAKMNQKAVELGLENTNFANPTGLDPKNLPYNPTNLSYFNYSTGESLIKLAQYILENHPEIFETTTKRGPYVVYNGLSNLSLPENLQILGGKTGYTYEAGGCILLVLRDEKENIFFNVILGAFPGETRITQTQKLIDYLLQ